MRAVFEKSLAKQDCSWTRESRKRSGLRCSNWLIRHNSRPICGGVVSNVLSTFPGILKSCISREYSARARQSQKSKPGKNAGDANSSCGKAIAWTGSGQRPVDSIVFCGIEYDL